MARAATKCDLCKKGGRPRAREEKKGFVLPRGFICFAYWSEAFRRLVNLESSLMTSEEVS